MTLLELAKKHKAYKLKPTNIHYLDIYEKWFAPYKDKPIKLLEIGVYKGGSMKMWEEYFPNAMIYGLDKSKKSKKYRAPRIKIEIGDQGDEAFMKDYAERHEFDIIIDDGGHHMHQQKTSLCCLFSVFKSLYIIEDLVTSYRPEFGDGVSTVEMLKDSIDILNHTGNVKGLHFYKNICLIEKNV